ncbi:heparinase II/III family protein [Pelagibius marinus]|uniref:heparinase II/III family protein n=1 Tax=Pelagibius marinus TaxID=2762760 RepID=UPI001872641F|nr:heparinase II/III family protein [Pelagibius marinus]
MASRKAPDRKTPERKAGKRRSGRRSGGPGGSLERLKAWSALPRDLALGRLSYQLKRPLFALPQMPWHWRGNPPATAALVPPDPWPGNAQRGGAILDDSFHFLGRSLTKPAPLWNPVGVERAWLEVLHGFSWLRDLRAAGGDNARRKARTLVADWIEANRAWAPVAWHPVVTGSRLAHWLGQYEFFAASADVEFRQRLLTAAARQARHLAAVLPAGLSGAGLVTAAKGLCMAGLCLPEGGPWLSRGLALLTEALEAQILNDGGQRERNPALLLSVLRDCIDLRAALLAAGREVPSDLGLRIEGMAAMLRLLQHGDGGLALFNGANEGEDLQIGLVLQRAASGKGPLQSAPASGFQRLQAGRSLVLLDSGRPPPPGYDAQAHAGTLSLEMSVGRERLIVNCGAQAGSFGAGGAGDWGAAQRSTAAHSTVTVEDTNSSEVFAGGGFGARRANVTCRRDEDQGSIWLEASHDGYQPLFGLTHHRRLYLSANGDDLRGEDRLSREGDDAQKRSAPRDFAVRFHLHPEVQAMAAQDGRSVVLRLPKGGGWRLRSAGAALSLEPSVYLGQPGQVRRSQQIVLSGSLSDGETTVKWALQRLESAR